MEKVIYSLTSPAGVSSSDFRVTLLGQVSEDLTARGAHAVQVNVADDDVARADGLRIATSAHPADAVVSVWLDSAVDRFRSGVDRVLDAASATLAAYLVTESVPLDDTRRLADPGGRVDGWSQMAFIRRPNDQDVDAWFDIWLDSHTQIALDTQDTFLYVQNAVVRVLTDGAPPWDAIVEEGFPAAAMDDPHAFFDTGDDEVLAERQQNMFESVRRFIDLSTIEVIPTSRYVPRRLPRSA